MLSIFTSTMFFFNPPIDHQSTSTDLLKPVMTTGLVNMHIDQFIANLAKAPILASPMQTVRIQTRQSGIKFSGLIWIQAVCNSDGIIESVFFSIFPQKPANLDLSTIFKGYMGSTGQGLPLINTYDNRKAGSLFPIPSRHQSI